MDTASHALGGGGGRGGVAHLPRGGGGERTSRGRAPGPTRDARAASSSAGRARGTLAPRPKRAPIYHYSGEVYRGARLDFVSPLAASHSHARAPRTSPRGFERLVEATLRATADHPAARPPRSDTTAASNIVHETSSRPRWGAPPPTRAAIPTRPAAPPRARGRSASARRSANTNANPRRSANRTRSASATPSTPTNGTRARAPEPRGRFIHHRSAERDGNLFRRARPAGRLF